MTAIQVGHKDALYLDDVQHRVVERLDDGRLVLETISDGRRRAVTDDDLARALAAESLRIVRAGMATKGTTILGDFQEMPEEKKFRARRRHRYLSIAFYQMAVALGRRLAVRRVELLELAACLCRHADTVAPEARREGAA